MLLDSQEMKIHACMIYVSNFITARKRSLRRLCFYRCLSVHRGGMCGCSWGACVVAPGGGMRGCSGGCVWLLPGGCAWLLGGRAWLLLGGHAWLLPGGHAWLLPGGCAWLLRGACMVAPRGGMRGCSLGGMRGCSGGGMRGCSWWLHVFFDEIRSMSGRYASYWNAFVFETMFILPFMP